MFLRRSPDIAPDPLIRSACDSNMCIPR
jgi:hypothetical protein